MVYRPPMILTPLELADIPARLAQFADGLAEEPYAARILARIGATLSAVRGDDIELSQCPDHHGEAVALLARFGMRARDIAPEEGVTWDGEAVSVRMEPSVIIHEVAHFQIAPPERRHKVDFALGAGPESGDKKTAETHRAVHGVDCDREEALVSLLGILWEAELGQPAILAFLEQNWLEGGASPHNLGHFVKIVGQLRQGGYLDEDGRPTMKLNDQPGQ